jgi:hypothetical protein
MRNLTLGDLLLALPDLLERRASNVSSTLSAQLYLRLIESVYREIAALPFATAAPNAFVQELAAADARHDAYAGALALFAQAYLRLPDLDPNDRATLESLGTALIPALDDVRDTYATQASRAIERGGALEPSQREILTRFRIRGDESLATLFDAYVATGRELDELLRRRADESQHAAPNRQEAGQLRGRAIGLLGQLRSSLAAEFADQPERAADLDAQTFAYIDALNAARESRGSADPATPIPVVDATAANAGSTAAP